MSFHPLIRGFIALTNMLGVELQGSDRYEVNQTGLPKGMEYKYLSSLSSVKNIERIKEGMRSVQWIGTHSMPMTDDGQGGPDHQA